MPLSGQSQSTTDDERLRAALNQFVSAKSASHAGDLVDTLEGIDASDFEPGVILFQQGEPVRRIFILLSGIVDEVRAREGPDLTTAATEGAAESKAASLQVREATAGSALGLYELVGRQPHNTTARSRTACKALVIEASQAYRLFYSDPSLRSAVAPIGIINRLRTMPLLASADGVTISHLADAVTVRTLAANATLYQAGDTASTLYLIDQGQVLLEHEDGRRRWLGNGMEFGMGDRGPASADATYELDHSARTLCPVTLYCLPLIVFRALTGLSAEAAAAAQRSARADAVARTGVFHTLTDDERAHLLGFMGHAYVPRRHLLTQQGEIADSLWILFPGQQAAVSAIGAGGEATPNTRVEGPAYFNFEALFRQVHATGTLEAEAGSSWLRLHWTDYRAFLEQTGRAEVAERLAKAQAEVASAATPPKLYPWQEDGERIIQESRRHWVAALTRMLPALMLLILSGWLTLAATQVTLRGQPLIYTPVVLFTLGVFWVLVLLLFAWSIADYRNDYLIVTNLRVVHQEKIIFLSESRRVAPLERVQDVIIDRRFWANLLGYADLTVQSAASEGSIRFDRAAQFEKIAAAIRREGAERKRHFQATGRAEIQLALEKRLGRTLALPSRVWVRADTSVAAGATTQPASRLAAWVARVAGQGGSDAPQETAPPQTGASKGERHVWHKHWLILFRSLFLPLVGLTVAMTLAGGVWIGDLIDNFKGSVTALLIFLASICLFFVWYQWENWRNDIYILEADTLIDIERKPLALQSDERRAPLSQIVDLQLRVPTTLHYIFNFGTVKAQTAATGSVFTFANVPKPGVVIEIIRKNMDENRRMEERRHLLQRAQEFPEWLDIFSRLEADRENDLV